MNVVIFGDELAYNRLPYTKLKDAILKISENGGNTIRLWLGAETFEFEWGVDDVGKYDNRQNRMFDFDDLLDLAEKNDVYFQLTINEAYEFSELWDNNPYRTLLGSGEDQDAFFTKQSCKDLHKQKLRYIISRWGYSPNIFAFEMWNEVDFYKPNNGFWNNKSNVENWHIEMIEYAKRLDFNRHMFTTSTGSISAGDVLYGLEQIDFVPDHHYSTDFNSEFQYNYLTKFSLNNYKKPYLLAEYGDDYSGCWLGTSNFTSSGYSLGNFFHDVNQMHQTIWSSAFSGAGGSGLFWWADHVFNDCWGGQYQYLKPLSKFMNNVDLLDKPLTSISNNCTCSGLKDSPHPDWCGSNPSPNKCHPVCKTGENSANIINTNYSIATSNDCKIEVFALVDEDKVVGWIHNKDNYWYNLPHNAGPINTPICTQLNDNQPSIPDDITTLTNETITLSNLPCDGEYKIEFFSTYPEYDIDNDGINDNGGIIHSFTINSINAHCGELTFTIPKLQALGTAPFAPDYGFKVSKIKNSWSNIILNSDNCNYFNETGPDDYINIFFNCPDYINGDISGDNKNIFYHGYDDRLQHFWYENGQWNHEWLTDWNNTSQNVGGDISHSERDVFYRGTDNRLHHYWYDNDQWNHEWLTNWNNTSQNVGGAISYSNGNVFYRGTDKRLHHYWYDNGQWNHEWLTDWNNTSQNVGGDIAYYGRNVFYKGIDGRLHYFWYGNNQWNHGWLTNWSNTSENVGGSISTPKIDGKVFYEGSDNRLHQYYFLNGQWNHTWHTDWTNTSQNIGGDITCSPDGSHVFYRGNDGYIHQQYYMGDGQWGHDWMVCYDNLKISLKAKSHISSSNDKVFYEGSDSKVHIWEYGTQCNPRSSDMIPGNETEFRNKVVSEGPSLLSVQNNIELGGKISPNPFSNNILIQDVSENQSIKIYDALGRIFYESTDFNYSELYIDTQSWPKGMFIINVQQGNRSNNIKLIKHD